MAELQETSSQYAENIRCCDYTEVGKDKLQWFSVQRSQQVPIDDSMITEKALFLCRKV